MQMPYSAHSSPLGACWRAINCDIRTMYKSQNKFSYFCFIWRTWLRFHRVHPAVWLTKCSMSQGKECRKHSLGWPKCESFVFYAPRWTSESIRNFISSNVNHSLSFLFYFPKATFLWNGHRRKKQLKGENWDGWMS